MGGFPRLGLGWLSPSTVKRLGSLSEGSGLGGSYRESGRKRAKYQVQGVGDKKGVLSRGRAEEAQGNGDLKEKSKGVESKEKLVTFSNMMSLRFK